MTKSILNNPYSRPISLHSFFTASSSSCKGDRDGNISPINFRCARSLAKVSFLCCSFTRRFIFALYSSQTKNRTSALMALLDFLSSEINSSRPSGSANFNPIKDTLPTSVYSAEPYPIRIPLFHSLAFLDKQRPNSVKRYCSSLLVPMAIFLFYPA